MPITYQAYFFFLSLSSSWMPTPVPVIESSKQVLMSFICGRSSAHPLLSSPSDTAPGQLLLWAADLWPQFSEPRLQGHVSCLNSSHPSYTGNNL